MDMLYFTNYFMEYMQGICYISLIYACMQSSCNYSLHWFHLCLNQYQSCQDLKFVKKMVIQMYQITASYAPERAHGALQLLLILSECLYFY